MKTITFSLPEYTIDQKPDYSFGSPVDRLVEEHFDVGNIVIRSLSSQDHPLLSLDELAEIIAEKGTDKYDPARKGVAHDEFTPYGADFQAGPWKSAPDTGSVFGDIMRDFYEKTPFDRGYALRIDLLLIYDRNQLTQAEKTDPGAPGVHPRLEPYLFRFREPEHKTRALIGIIKITGREPRAPAPLRTSKPPSR